MASIVQAAMCISKVWQLFMSSYRHVVSTVRVGADSNPPGDTLQEVHVLRWSEKTSLTQSIQTLIGTMAIIFRHS